MREGLTVVMVTFHDGRALADYPTLGDAVADLRQMWCEEEGEQAFLVQGEGCILACLMRDQSDPEFCHTLYADGNSETHRCHYVLDADGHYQRTEVIRVAAAGMAV